MGPKHKEAGKPFFRMVETSNCFPVGEVNVRQTIYFAFKICERREFVDTCCIEEFGYFVCFPTRWRGVMLKSVEFC